MKHKQRIEIEKKFINFELNKKAFEWVDKNILPIKDFYLQIGIMLYWFNFLNITDEIINMTVHDARRIYNRFFRRDEIYELLKPENVCFRRYRYIDAFDYLSILVSFNKTHVKNPYEEGNSAIKVVFYYNQGKKSKAYPIQIINYPIQIIDV